MPFYRSYFNHTKSAYYNTYSTSGTDPGVCRGKSKIKSAPLNLAVYFFSCKLPTLTIANTSKITIPVIGTAITYALYVTALLTVTINIILPQGDTDHNSIISKIRLGILLL